MSGLHIIKLCVGAESLADLLAWERGRGAVSTIHTRSMPKQRDALLDGGSLYWVIKGLILCRRRILSLEPVKNSPVPLVHIGLSTQHFATQPMPKRPFQGWRYLTAKDAPPDLLEGNTDLPPEFVLSLKEAGAW
jgi:hypothetical protein